ncbi:40S Ribosomal Protein Sa [Manis pentadactyla]|nr:40S Ribosomal Protein Sa [Manis pentadactyla]
MLRALHVLQIREEDILNYSQQEPPQRAVLKCAVTGATPIAGHVTPESAQCQIQAPSRSRDFRRFLIPGPTTSLSWRRLC